MQGEHFYIMPLRAANKYQWFYMRYQYPPEILMLCLGHFAALLDVERFTNLRMANPTEEKALETEETMSLVSKSIEAFHADEVEEKGGVTLELPEKSTRSQKTDVVVSMDTAFERKLAELEKEDWYHGCLPYEDIVGLLKEDGDFLLRGLEAEGGRNTMACLTVRWEGKTMDFPIHTLLTENQGHTFTLDGKRTSNDIMGLVNFHRSHYRLQQEINGVMLKNPVMKAQWELTKNKITLVKKIGAGEGGEVWQGTLREASNKPPIDVAIKMTKVVAENKHIVDAMYKEARLMRQYKHKNVVAFYGIVQDKPESAMIVMELIDGGNLKMYLRKNKDTIPVKSRISFAIDVAVGLTYLHTKGCMHRDIACRNCLIDLKNNVVKITDFGLSKVAESYNIPPTEKLPIRWQAPEVVLTRFYTEKSDVYSYGILLWEIFHNGSTPYKQFTNKEVRLKVSNPQFRPSIDPNVPIVAYRVMKACWRGNPKKRPKMADAARYLIHAKPEL
ncbi:hypothetical protein Q1695_004758 [Nippostrongylus brasiliensis]|nr:hypothetical protein Q1695_004758 [Nippostrongylus brasiliensis]